MSISRAHKHEGMSSQRVAGLEPMRSIKKFNATKKQLDLIEWPRFQHGLALARDGTHMARFNVSVVLSLQVHCLLAAFKHGLMHNLWGGRAALIAPSVLCRYMRSPLSPLTHRPFTSPQIGLGFLRLI